MLLVVRLSRQFDKSRFAKTLEVQRRKTFYEKSDVLRFFVKARPSGNPRP